MSSTTDEAEAFINWLIKKKEEELRMADPIIINAENDCRFMVREEHINTVSGDHELVWQTDPQTLSKYLEDRGY